MASSTHIAIIGAGIVGLTTALEIQSRLGHTVTIFAASFPGDKKSIDFTSPWAGAHHVSISGDDARKLELERETFKRLWEASSDDSEEAKCFTRTAERDYFGQDMTGRTGLEHMPDFRPLTSEELITPAISGVAYTTINIDTAVYLPFLLARFLARGGRIRRVFVQHIDQILLGAWGTSVPDALIICAGIGARFLGGVEDKDVYPIRGQTVLIRAPWVQEGRMMKVNSELQHGDYTYVIARRSGDVVLGGTKHANDWYPHPRPETGRAILARALALMPDLAPPTIRDLDRPTTVEDLEPLVIEHGCGLRPARIGGIRLERSTVRTGIGSREVQVVYNYGHGGAGYQASWGSARVVVDMLEEGLLSQEN